MGGWALVLVVRVACSPARKCALSAACYRCGPVDEPLIGASAPVAGKQGPHDRAKVEFTRGFRHPGTAQAPRRTKPSRRRASVLGGDDGILAAAQLIPRSSEAHAKKIRMCLRVIAQDVATGVEFANQRGACAGVAANQEKCGVSVVAREQIEQFRRYRRIGSVVKGDRQFARRIRARNGGAEQLRARIRRTISRQARSRGENGGRGQEPWIHACILARLLTCAVEGAGVNAWPRGLPAEQLSGTMLGKKRALTA